MNNYKSPIAIALAITLFSSPSVLANTDKKFEISTGYQAIDIDENELDVTGKGYYLQAKYHFDNDFYIKAKHFDTEGEYNNDSISFDFRAFNTTNELVEINVIEQLEKTLEFQQTNIGFGKNFSISENKKGYLEFNYLTGELTDRSDISLVNSTGNVIDNNGNIVRALNQQEALDIYSGGNATFTNRNAVDYDGLSLDTGITFNPSEPLFLTLGVRYEWIKLDVDNLDDDTDNDTIFYVAAKYEINESLAIEANFELYDDVNRYQAGINYRF